MVQMLLKMKMQIGANAFFRCKCKFLLHDVNVIFFLSFANVDFKCNANAPKDANANLNI